MPAIIWAQTKTIKGTANNKTGTALPGVTILAKNSKNLGATTDFDGNFNITIPSNQTKILVFSYLGYVTQEVDVTGINQVNVFMIEDQTQLDEVVVFGYGTVKKSNLTGAVTSVIVEDEVARQSNTIINFCKVGQMVFKLPRI